MHFLAIEVPSTGDNPSGSSSSSTTSLNIADETINATNQPNTAESASAINTANASVTPPVELKVENNPDGGVWITSQGVFYFKLNSLHIHLQFFYSVLKVCYYLFALSRCLEKNMMNFSFSYRN